MNKIIWRKITRRVNNLQKNTQKHKHSFFITINKWTNELQKFEKYTYNALFEKNIFFANTEKTTIVAVSGDRNMRVIPLFYSMITRSRQRGAGVAGMQTNNYRTILIIRRREWIYVFHCIREITGNTGPGFVVWRVKSMTNAATKPTEYSASG